jgi:hypothetical protein
MRGSTPVLREDLEAIPRRSPPDQDDVAAERPSVFAVLSRAPAGLAHQAITAEIDIGLLLPCNVIVYEGESQATSVVAAIDPVAQLGIAGREDLRSIAEEVKDRLERVLAAL